MNVLGNVKKVTLGGMFVGAMMLAGSLSITGCLTDDKKDSTGTTKSTPWPTTSKTYSVGAQGAAAGSTVDVDAASGDDGVGVLKSALANQNKAKIDFVFASDPDGGAITVFNGKAAFDAGIKLAESWDSASTYPNLSSVKFVKVSTAPTDEETGKSTFTAGPQVTSLSISQGDMFLVMSSESKLALVTVTTIGGSGTNSTGALFIKVSTL